MQRRKLGRHLIKMNKPDDQPVHETLLACQIHGWPRFQGDCPDCDREASEKEPIYRIAVALEKIASQLEDIRKSLCSTKLTSGMMVRMSREAQKMNQMELAKFSGFAQSYISDIERDNKKLGIKTAERLARVLKVSVATLLWPS